MPNTASASSFIDSVGVCTHLSYTNTPYAQTGKIVSILGDIGFRHIRDGASWYPQGNPSGNQINYGRWSSVRTAGVDITAVLDYTTVNPPTPSLLSSILQLAGTPIEFEPPNEFDDSGYIDWIPRLQTYQQSMYQSVKANGAIPVLGPALANASNYQYLGNLSSYLDYGNVHAYYGNLAPGGQINPYVTEVRNTCSLKPIVVTETGYNNALNTTLAGGWEPLDELTTAKYLLRTLFLNWNVGVVRTFIYELVDEFYDPWLTSVQAHYGLLRNDLTYKPAATGIKNLLSVFADPAFVSANKLGLGYAPNPATLEKAVFSKQDGTFLIVLWQEVSSWNGAEIKVAPLKVEVKTSLTSVSSATVFDPLTGTTTTLPPGTNVILEVPDYPVILLVKEK